MDQSNRQNLAQNPGRSKMANRANNPSSQTNQSSFVSQSSFKNGLPGKPQINQSLQGIGSPNRKDMYQVYLNNFQAQNSFDNSLQSQFNQNKNNVSQSGNKTSSGGVLVAPI